MHVHEDGRLRLVKIGPLGPYDNNLYVIHDREDGDAIIVDAPEGAEQALDGLQGAKVRRIVMTHRHADHWSAVETLKEATKAPVACHPADKEPHAALVDETFDHGDAIIVGGLRVKVIHTPGHTPGSVCFLVANHLISGDTLFPGGPGRTERPEDLQQEIESIRTRLFDLPDGVLVHPGHGDDGTIGASRREYAVFASKDHPPDLCGDVTWEGS